MPILELTPHTVSDSFYSMGREQPSSMRSLSNLVPAPDSPDQWVARPAAVLYPGSNAFTPGFVSAQIVIGNRLYGMVSSALNSGKDQPFCYDLVTQALVSISGITAGNTPTSPAATGAWTVPHMELIGVKIIVTHPGFSGSGANFFGVIDTSNPGALSWTASNTATNLLPSVPVWVNQFGGRAYYFCNPVNGQPAILATDVLDPLTITNGTFVLTFGDNIPLLCGGTLALNNQLGGIIQGLIVFKGATNVFQVTGDFALLTTAINSLNVATGTLSPNSVTTTPKGLIFMAPDGLRIIDFQGNISDPIGVAGTGIAVPFLSSVIPSRICAASNASTIRLSTQNGATLNNTQQEWCFDFTRGAWHGPHTFPVSLISEYGNSFVVSPIGIKGLWSSDIIPNTSSTYIENNAFYVCDYLSGNMPERAGVVELNTVKALLYIGAGAGVSIFLIIAQDDAGNPLNTVGVSFTSTITTWDHFTWGSGASLGVSQQLSALDIPWSFPIVFDRMAVRVQMYAAAGVRIGKFIMEYQPTGYTSVGPVQGVQIFNIPVPPPPPLLLPVSANQSVTTPVNVPIVVDLTVGASGGLADSAALIGVVTNGATSGFPVTLVTFTPTSGFVGTGSFQFVLINSTGMSTPSTVTITVTGDAGLPPLLSCMGSQPSSARIILINNALVSLRAAGLLAKLDVLYVCAVEASNQSLCNWIDPTKFHAVTNGSPGFVADRGWLGASGYIDTTWIPSTNAVNFTLNNASAFAWTADNTNTASTLLGATNLLITGIASNISQARLNEPSGSSQSVSGSTKGLYTIVRTSAPNFIQYRDTTSIATYTLTSTVLDSASIQFANASDRRIMLMGAGAALTPTDVTNLYNIFSTYFTAIGAPF
jgi:hypothetical protein